MGITCDHCDAEIDYAYSEESPANIEMHSAEMCVQCRKLLCRRPTYPRLINEWCIIYCAECDVPKCVVCAGSNPTKVREFNRMQASERAICDACTK